MKLRFYLVSLFTGICFLYSCEEKKVIPLEDKCFTSSDLKIGDYYYEDGSWSDGGLRRIGQDGEMLVAEPKPAPLEGKTPIGVVFQTDISRMGAGVVSYLKEMGVDSIHGLVLSLKTQEHGKSFPWGGWDILLGEKEEPSMKELYGNVDGFSNTKLYWEHEYHQISFLSTWSVWQRNQTDSIERISSPWFVPSAGQWYDILHHLGGLKDSGPYSFENSHLRGNFMWFGKEGVSERLNSWMSMIPDTCKDVFGTEYDHYWTSSRFNRFRQYYVAYIDKAGTVYIDWNSVGYRHKVRCILAF